MPALLSALMVFPLWQNPEIMAKSIQPFTLSTLPPVHNAVDYDFLRQEGIRYLEQFAGQLWTDFNVHDPGITILEQVCYALTDLAYRISYPMPDLLTDQNGSTKLFTPAQILTTNAVTLMDLRKLIIDVSGVKNAWVEVIDGSQQTPPLYFVPDNTTPTLSLQADAESTDLLALQGLYQVLIECIDPTEENCNAVVERVAQRLHAQRGLCEDLVTIKIAQPQKIHVEANIEITAVDNADDVLVAIYQKIADYIAPPIVFKRLDQLLAAGIPIEDIFEGPLLDHGFIDSDQLRQAQRRTTLHTSDIIREIMDIPGVKAVQRIKIATGTKQDDWSLELDSDDKHDKAPRLDVIKSDIQLKRNGLPVNVDANTKNRFIEQSKHTAVTPQTKQDIPPPVGKNRNIEHYTSIQHQFPATYGIGALGLPASATPQRQAQAQQLKAYLLFFDQLLANYFSQLAHAKDLFSFESQTSFTYFSQTVNDPSLDLDGIFKDDPEQTDYLQAITEKPHQDTTITSNSTVINRQNRFLNHLLARFAEQFADYSLILYDQQSSTALDDAAKIAKDKQLFLENYPEISSRRGAAFNYLASDNQSYLSGLQKRIQYKLGLAGEVATILVLEGEKANFFMVEHILLRPYTADLQQNHPILTNPIPNDPYSLQISFILPARVAGLKDNAKFRAFVERTIYEETPAHLYIHIHWLSKDEMATFRDVYQEWVTHYESIENIIVLHDHDKTKHIQFRARRDRLIDRLQIGQTYPIQDLPVDDKLIVAFNTTAKITIPYSQKGVLYQLHHNKELVTQNGGDNPIHADGNGTTIDLDTNKITENITFEILATKQNSNLAAYLHQEIVVEVGLDISLKAWILEASHLSTQENLSKPFTDNFARIIAVGESVTVEIENSQNDVDYTLVVISEDAEHIISPQSIRGNFNNITLSTIPIDADIDIRIRATKTFEEDEIETQTELLAIVLPLRVRAITAQAITIGPSNILDYNQAGTLTIANAQNDVSYELFIHTIRDQEFKQGETENPDLLRIKVDKKPDVLITKPTYSDAWLTPDNYSSLDIAQIGNGTDLQFSLPALTDDSLIIVQAIKNHRPTANPTDTQIVTSATQLKATAVLLIRPNPKPPLSIQISQGETAGKLYVSGGQPGIFYTFRKGKTTRGKPIGLPAYFHKRDDTDPAMNKGIGQLKIGVDFVVIRPYPSDIIPNDQTPAPTPIIDIEPLPASTILHIHAVKAQTQIITKIEQTYPVSDLEPPDTEEEAPTDA